MQREIWDISRLSHLRRRIEFPRRLAEATVRLFGVAVIFIVLGVGSAGRSLSAPGEELLTFQIFVYLFVSAMLCLLFFVTKGRRWAILGFVALMTTVIGVDVVDLALDVSTGLIYHYVPPTLSGLSALERLELDYSNDVRLLAGRLCSLLLMLLYVSLFWRMIAAHFPRRTAPTRSELALVFASPPRFSMIWRNLGHWRRHPAEIGALVRTFLAGLLYLLYFVAAALRW